MAGLTIGGISANHIYEQAVDSGLTQIDASLLVSGWIYENFGKSKRTFNYNQSFAATEPACQPEFDRSFSHSDWIDGESVVQAQTSAGELGFNDRFHQIEADFDAVKADLFQAFNCMSQSRAEIKARFDELRAEINRINQDIYDCCHKDDGGGIVYPGANNFGSLVQGGSFMGNIKMNEKYVALWNTPQGYMMLPTVYSVGTDFISDEKIQNPARVAKTLAENRSIQEAFGNGPVNKQKLIEQFGNTLMDNGETLSMGLTILPSHATYESLDHLQDDLSERQALSLKMEHNTEKAVSEAFGMSDTTMESLEKAPLSHAEFLPKNIRVALDRQGVKTLGDLANVKNDRLRETLQNESVEVSLGQASEWRSVAATLVNLQR